MKVFTPSDAEMICVPGVDVGIVIEVVNLPSGAGVTLRVVPSNCTVTSEPGVNPEPNTERMVPELPELIERNVLGGFSWADAS